MTISIKTMAGDNDEALGVAIYAFSAVHDPEAIRLQLDDCGAIARSMFSRSPAVFFDTGVSGPAADRKGLNELMTEIEAGTVFAVVIRNVERISRNFFEASEFCSRVRACGAEQHFLSGVENLCQLRPE